MQNLIETVESCEFECDAGNLKQSNDWIKLKIHIELLRQQLAERDALIAELVLASTELRKWVADGEYSDDSGIFPNCATEEYKSAVQKFDEAIDKAIKENA